MSDDQDRSSEGRSNVFAVLPAATAVPPLAFVTSASIVAFDANGDILAVELGHRGLDIPGGHKEPGDLTLEDVVRRETTEEACATLDDDLQVAVVIGSTMLVDGQPSFMVVMTGSVGERRPVEFAPGEKSTGRRMVSPEDLIASFEGHPFMAEVIARACEVRRAASEPETSLALPVV